MWISAMASLEFVHAATLTIPPPGASITRVRSSATLCRRSGGRQDRQATALFVGSIP